MLLCEDIGVELMQEVKNSNVIIQCYNTTNCTAYHYSFMIIVKNNNNSQYKSYFTDIVDMFYYFNMIL